MKYKKDFNLNEYHHQINETVKFHEVDLMGVLNNAVYFNYFEDARISYVKQLVNKFNLKKFMNKNSYIIMAHNDCDYFEPAVFEDELIVHSKIVEINNSSFKLSHIVQNKHSGTIIAAGGGVVVHFDTGTKNPIPLPKEFSDAVNSFEN